MKPKDTRTKKTAAEYLKEPYARVLIPEEEGGYSAELLEFPGCVSQGDSAEEALGNLEEAATNWIEETLKRGGPIPPPSANYGYSGKVALRLPRSIHRKAMEIAERDGVSLNTFLVSAVAARVGAVDLISRLVSTLDRQLERIQTRAVSSPQFVFMSPSQSVQLAMKDLQDHRWTESVLQSANAPFTPQWEAKTDV